MTDISNSNKFWNDTKYRATLLQVIILSFVISIAWWLFNTTINNLESRGISSGFDFLKRSAGFDISFSLIEFDSSHSNGEVFLVGLINTLLVSFISIIFATIIGIVIGIARLSNNWVISKLATVYIEVFRNIPLLLQIFFWYFAVLSSLPNIRYAMKNGFLDNTIFLSNRGITLPKPIFEDGSVWVLISLITVVILIIIIKIKSNRKQDKTGDPPKTIALSISLIIIIPLVALIITGFPISLDIPKPSRFNMRGGVTLIPEFMALLLSLSIYTGAFIAEIVRSGIVSVNHGQTEAAYSLAISPSQTLRLIIIPQALRVIIPPLASQYLNLAKNSSLAAAIAYPELVSVFTGTVLNNSGQALECVALTMLAYLIISLSIAVFMNWYNKSIELVER